MRRPFFAFSPARALGVAALALFTAACSPSGPGPAGPAKTLGLPLWQGPERELFGDEIDPAALGILPPKPPRKDQTLWARSQRAEIVGRVRVQTVTVDSRLGQATYHLGLQFANPLLAESKLEDRTFEVTIEAGDPSYGLVKAQDTALQGKTFVGFVRRYAGQDDEIVNHFYLAPDSADVAAVVLEAVAVQEVSR
ncbi:MAG: cobalamin ABC transporter substrate-binding protein [Polyangiaceae bacterium]|nr:cobalamin ABC transporter substrate-binding protein [Polyangiaceae bacterium]